LLVYIKIVRPANLGIIVLTQLLLRFCVIETYFGLGATVSALGYFDLALLILSTLLIAAGGYVINDYYDREIDMSNKPGDVIAGQQISVNKILKYYWALTALGVMTGFYLAIKIEYFILGFIFPAVAILLWFYSSTYQEKVLLGNVMIVSLSALVIVVLWLFEFFALKAEPIRFVEAMKQIGYLHAIVAGYALFAFFVSLAREIVKDIEDQDGDVKGGYKTLSIVYGIANAKRVTIAIHLVTMVLLGGCMFLLYQEKLMLVFWYLMCAVQLLFLFVLYHLIISREKKDFHFLSNAYKIIMLAGILSMQLFYISY